MNEDFQNRIKGYLDAVESAANTAGEFAAEQVPLVAQEYLAWCFWSAWIGIAVACIGLAVSVLIVVVGWVSKSDEFLFVGSVFALMLLIGSLLMGGCAVENLVKVTVAPRVVLLEKAAELLKENGK